jgi:GT2 family glycosyltransferase
MKDISIILPSLRPREVNKTISEFYDTNSDVNYEIIVVSPFEVMGLNVKWIPESERLGTIMANNIALAFVKGRYVVYFSDDVSPTTDCLENMIYFMDKQRAPFIGAFKMTTPTGKEIGPFGAYNKLYACYGCISIKTMNLVVGYLDMAFKDSWADIDLSLRVWEAGGSVEICQDAIVIPRQIEDDIYKKHRESFQTDYQTFLGKWHHKLGKGISRHDGDVNHKL